MWKSVGTIAPSPCDPPGTFIAAPRTGALLWPEDRTSDLGWHLGTTALGAGIGWLWTHNQAGMVVGAAVGAAPVTTGIGWLITHTAKGAIVGGALGGGLTLLAILFGNRS